MSLNISLFIFPSESLVREPPPCSLTGSPRTGILRHQSRWSVYSFVHVCLPKSPKRSPPTYGEKHRSLSTEPHADRMPTHDGVWPGSPISTLVPRSPWHDTWHLGLGRPEPR